MVVGYDPIQRSQQWKRRIDREELAICNNMLASGGGMQHPAVVDADTRLELLSQQLTGAGGQAAPASSRGGRSGLQSGLSARSRSSAGNAGRAIALTPRLNSAQSASSYGSGMLDVPHVQQTAMSALSSVSRGMSSAAASSTLRAELEEETRRRVAAEAELNKLRSMLDDS